MRRSLLAILLLFPLAANAQVMTGATKAIDGDTLEMGGQRIRLHGIDALEAQQTCSRNGETWHCGQEAAALLARVMDGKPVACEQRDLDAYRRVVAVCRAGGLDLAQIMIEAGLAVALPQFSQGYIESEAKVRSFGIGIWGARFETPADYRAAHPDQFRAPARPIREPTRPRAVQARGVYYANCTQARAAGAAPIYYGQPGYRPEMDGDGDGIACEPYRGRR